MYPGADAHLCLVVCCCAKDLALLGGDCCVAVDHAGEHTTQRLNTQGQGRHIKQQNILHVTTQHTTLQEKDIHIRV